MMSLSERAVVALIAICLLSATGLAGDGFVPVKGGTFHSFLRGDRAAPMVSVRVDDFEMLDHPVTNAEYKVFVDAARHAPPPYWVKNQIPPGMENVPVVMVTRFDAAAYIRWRSAREKRVYRLPTASEYEYAARAGAEDAIYPWGKEEPSPERANYDSAGDRPYDQWRRFIRPVKSYSPNRWGLYDLAGNVFQMVEVNRDPALDFQYVFRIASAVEKAERETAITGGSWARTSYYLGCGVMGGSPSGARHADLGFRVVREPAASTHFQSVSRRVVAMPAGGGAVFLSWQVLPGDPPDAGFHVYRSIRRDAAGERVTPQPARDGTNFVDRSAPRVARVYYRVRIVGPQGSEGPPSEWAGVNPGSPASNLVATLLPSSKQEDLAPIFGDLDGDGNLDVVFRLANGMFEGSPDPGIPVELEAVGSYGKSWWRRPLVAHDRCFGNAHNVPVVVYDLDGDGKAEIAARLQEGEKVYLAVLDGLTGKVFRRTPWPPLVSDFAHSSTRIHLAVAYLDGKSPALITQSGLYENEILAAYDGKLNKLWEFKSFGLTTGSGSHRIVIADVDGDGKDEVFDGTTVLNPDGTVRWSIYRGHPDRLAVKHILPTTKDRQVFYAVESSVHAGAYLVDAKTGKILWKVNREDDPRWTHADIGWAADIWEGSPGMEMLTARDGKLAENGVLFAANGKILMEGFSDQWQPVNWTGGRVRDLMAGGARRLGRFNGSSVEALSGPGPNTLPNTVLDRPYCFMGADLVGDYRDEVACMGNTKDGVRGVFIFTNTEPCPRKAISRTANREYRLWLARNMGGGYVEYNEWEP